MSWINPSMQRFSSRLMGIYRGEDWVRMCSTAPAEINHVFFSSPTYCEHKVRTLNRHARVLVLSTDIIPLPGNFRNVWDLGS